MRLARALGLLALACGTVATPAGDGEVLAKFEVLERQLARIKAAGAQREAELLERIGRLESGGHERRLGIVCTAASDILAHVWLILCGALIFFMQAGFAMHQAGSCRAKSAQSILLKVLANICVGALAFWTIGWSLAYGFPNSDKARFAGTLQYFAHEFMESTEDGTHTPAPGNLMLRWFFQWAVCLVPATIAGGGVAERASFPAYIIFTLAMTAGIYPVVVGWTWSGKGWLNNGTAGSGYINTIGYFDFAGSGIVHLTGGTGALIGALCVGPRVGRFQSGASEDFAPHSVPLVVLGTLTLWFGWYGLNCGFTQGMPDTATGQKAALIAMNTTLSAASAGLTALLLRLAMTRRYDVVGMCNGILAGLVAISAGCSNVESGSAVAIGVSGAVLYQLSSSLLKRLNIDDPADAFAVHGVAGAWGVLAAAVFDWGKGFDYYNAAGGFSCLEDSTGSCINTAWKTGLLANLVEICAIFGWVAVLSLLILLPLRVARLLRVSDTVQEAGMDIFMHYPETAYALELKDADVFGAEVEDYEREDERRRSVV